MSTADIDAAFQRLFGARSSSWADDEDDDYRPAPPPSPLSEYLAARFADGWWAPSGGLSAIDGWGPDLDVIVEDDGEDEEGGQLPSDSSDDGDLGVEVPKEVEVNTSSSTSSVSADDLTTSASSVSSVVGEDDAPGETGEVSTTLGTDILSWCGMGLLLWVEWRMGIFG
ncbi:MAG: hypothetical protein M1836_000381 [Candelina mexicana]|nr:MAG: hypothetical protein M1836_000381 [Candelina mexicana]